MDSRFTRQPPSAELSQPQALTPAAPAAAAPGSTAAAIARPAAAPSLTPSMSAAAPASTPSVTPPPVSAAAAVAAAPANRNVIGRVHAVSGAHVTVGLSPAATATDASKATVGKFLGILSSSSVIV